MVNATMKYACNVSPRPLNKGVPVFASTRVLLRHYIVLIQHLAIFSGSYAYIDATGRRPNDRAQLQSIMLTPRSIRYYYCLRFWYNMYGANIGSLTVTMNIKGVITTMWQLKGQQTASPRGWGYANVPLKKTATSYQVSQRAFGEDLGRFNHLSNSVDDFH